MRFAIRAAVLFAAALLTGAAGPADVHHVRSVETRIAEGRTIVITTEQDGSRRLVRRCESQICDGTWFDGRRLFAFGVNGVLLPDSFADQAAERTRASAPMTGAAIDEPLEAPRGNLPQVNGASEIAWEGGPPAIVPCRVRERAARCLIDSGTTPSAMSLPFADALKLEPHGELEIEGATRFLTGVVDTGPVTVGSVRWEHFTFAVVPRFAALKFDVILGNDAIAGLRITLDARRRIARLEPSGAAPAGTVLPLRFAGGVALVDAVVGNEPEPLLLDTGDDAIVSVGYERFRLGDMIATATPEFSERTAGIGGSSGGFPARARLRVGGLDLGIVPARVNRAQTLGHLGFGLTDRCRLVIDEPAERAECGAR